MTVVVSTHQIRLTAAAVDAAIPQGLSAGVRLELLKRVILYGSLGQNKRNDETRASLTQRYGVTFTKNFDTGIRADLRALPFDSTFGRGSYRAVTSSREVSDRLRIELQGGQQEYVSALSQQRRTLYEE